MWRRYLLRSLPAGAADYIETNFRNLGLPTRIQSFPVLLRGEKVTGRNVFAVIQGTSSIPLLVVAHYDAAITSPEAAGDNGSGVATLLAPAAGAWPWLGAFPSRRGRILDALLLALGIAPFLILLVATGSHLFLGPWILWYGALLLGYGIVTLQVAVIAGLALSSALALLARPGSEGPRGTG